MSSRSDCYDLDTTYVHLGENGVSVPIEVTETFWGELAGGYFDHLGEGRLVSHFMFSRDWEVWEMHPKGEEVVCLLTGSMDLVLERDGIRNVIELRVPGSFTLVPRGAWHTARVHAPSSVMFITPGEGTEHRPLEEE